MNEIYNYNKICLAIFVDSFNIFVVQVILKMRKKVNHYEENIYNKE